MGAHDLDRGQIARCGDDHPIARLDEALKAVAEDDALRELVDRDGPRVKDLYEQVFNHKAFTGRSGGMYGYEGLGCIYWHMVAKLLLAVHECYRSAEEDGAGADVQKHVDDTL